jgi:hypothetical protein
LLIPVRAKTQDKPSTMSVVMTLQVQTEKFHTNRLQNAPEFDRPRRKSGEKLSRFQRHEASTLFFQDDQFFF